jgi:LacI family transcriptional regulator
LKLETKEINLHWEKATHSIVIDSQSGVPLHQQLRINLQNLIEKSFKNDDQFMTEDYLVEVLGLSRGTVRRALLDLSAEGLLERRRALGTVVRKATLKECKYLSVISPDYASPTNAEFLAALVEIGQNKGIHWNIIRLGLDQKMEILEKNISFKPEEGAILFLAQAQQLTVNLNQSFTRRGYLTVNIDETIENYPGHHVGMCNREAVRLGVEQLIRAGHRKIVFLVAEPEEYDTVKMRAQAFEEIIQEKALSDSYVYHAGIHAGENDSEAAALSMPYIWNQVSRPTAIFAISDGCAMGALSWLQSSGVRVPEDVSLLSFDGSAITRSTRPQLSSIRQPYQEIAQAVFRILEGRPKMVQNLLLDPDFVEGGSIQKTSAVDTDVGVTT